MNAAITMDHMAGNYPSPSNQTNDSAAATATRPLWAAVGVLGVCVLAMGASLVHIQQRPAEPTAAALASPMKSFFSQDTKSPENGGMITEMADDNIKTKPAETLKNAAQPATKSIAGPATKPVAASAKPVNQTAGNSTPATRAADTTVASNSPVAQSNPAPVVQAAPICASCGTVDSVTPITRDGRGSGAGAVAGGVVGAVLGNQVGQGNGRTAATILGAVGGGWAGNTIEKKVKKVTVYDVRVRMQDGSTRHFEQGAAPAVGAKVTVEGNNLRTSDGALLSQAAPAAPRAARNAPQTVANNTYNGSR